MGRNLLLDEIHLGTQLCDKRPLGLDVEAYRRMLELAADPTQFSATEKRGAQGWPR